MAGARCAMERGFMARLLTLEDLQAHFDFARDQLSLERISILKSTPLPHDFSRDVYGFSYMRAERLGLQTIVDALREVSWLPMQLDPQTEVLMASKEGLRKWIAAPARGQPDSSDFGNDFIHALARVALVKGWESAEFRLAALRIGQMFHDLSCLIALIYYGVWMAENGIRGVPVSNPYDLLQTAKEISLLSRSPEVARILEARERSLARSPKKKPPKFRVITNTDPPEGPLHLM